MQQHQRLLQQQQQQQQYHHHHQLCSTERGVLPARQSCAPLRRRRPVAVAVAAAGGAAVPRRPPPRVGGAGGARQLQRCRAVPPPQQRQQQQQQQQQPPQVAEAVLDADAAAAAAADADADAAAQPWVWEESGDAVAAYAALLGVLLVGAALPGALGSRMPAELSLPYFIALAACTVYVGSHRGLTAQARQPIGLRDGALAPLLASASLFGLYLLTRSGISLQGFFDVYFLALGTASIAAAARPLLRAAGGAGAWLARPAATLALPKGLLLDERGDDVTAVPVAPADVLALSLAAAAASLELAAHHTNFSLSNLVACTVVAEILALVGLRSFRAGALLLSGLLAYDAFWVFASPHVTALSGGDNVMLVVATSNVFAGPTRLLFPRAPGGAGEGAAAFPFSLLGAGDVAIPGLFAALALRFDAAAAARGAGKPPQEDPAGATAAAAGSLRATADVLRARPYFTAVALAHVAGLVAAFAANSVTGYGQPALVYICPAVLMAVAVTAARRGELGEVWAFVDETKPPGDAEEAVATGGGDAKQ